MVASPARARSHDRVVRRALDWETPLPARFGQVLADVAGLTRNGRVAPRRAGARRWMPSPGWSEMTVRMPLPAEAKEEVAPRQAARDRSTNSGRAYLERAAADQRGTNVLAKQGRSANG